MRAALREGRHAVRFFAEQDWLNGFFQVGRRAAEVGREAQQKGRDMGFCARGGGDRQAQRPLPAAAAAAAGPLAAPAVGVQRSEADQGAPP